MTRLLVLTAAIFSAFGLFLGVLLLGSWASMGSPLPLPVAMVLSGLIAPYFGWRLERLALRAMQDVHRRGAITVTEQPGPVLGEVMKKMAAMSKADASVLFLALRRDSDDEVVVATSVGSANDQLWSMLKTLELMGELAPEPELADESPVKVKRFYLTPKGREIIPGLVNAAAAIRRAAPELAMTA